MEQTRESVAAAIPTRMELQSIEDFEAEMDAMDIVRAAAPPKPANPINPYHLPKKPKRTVDNDALEAEKLAREEMGNEDWISELNNYRLTHPVAIAPSIGAQSLDYKEILITSSILRFAFTVKIAESSQLFGGASPSFSNKKDAKRYAAMKAVTWLTKHNHIQQSKQSVDCSKTSDTGSGGPIESPLSITEALEGEKTAREEIGSVNWYGKLIEYRNAHPITAPAGGPPTKSPPGIDCKESIVKFASIPRFAFTIEITESSTPFGGPIQTFSNKKDAKQYAAKKAIDWLIETNHMPSDGSVRFSQPSPPILGIQPKKRKLTSDSSTPEGNVKYTTLVPTLCTKLGFGPPRYELQKATDTAFWNGYALFPGNPIIDGKVGQATNVFGKDNAKEEIAKEVYRFLKDIQRQRQEQFDVQDT